MNTAFANCMVQLLDIHCVMVPQLAHASKKQRDAGRTPLMPGPVLLPHHLKATPLALRPTVPPSYMDKLSKWPLEAPISFLLALVWFSLNPSLNESPKKGTRLGIVEFYAVLGLELWKPRPARRPSPNLPLSASIINTHR